MQLMVWASRPGIPGAAGKDAATTLKKLIHLRDEGIERAKTREEDRDRMSRIITSGTSFLVAALPQKS